MSWELEQKLAAAEGTEAGVRLENYEVREILRELRAARKGPKYLNGYEADRFYKGTLEGDESPWRR